MSLLSDHNKSEWIRWAIGGVFVAGIAFLSNTGASLYSAGQFRQSVEDRFHNYESAVETLKTDITNNHLQEQQERQRAIYGVQKQAEQNSQMVTQRLDKIDGSIGEMRSQVDRAAQALEDLADEVMPSRHRHSNAQ